MHTFAAALALTGAASAAVLPRAQSGCCFELNASGGESGTLGQLSDGQNRIGGGFSPATYCINNGAITDASGRGCILTPPTTQFQCDTGASPTQGFSVSSNGEIEYNGDSTFYACGATSSEYNVYTTPVQNQADCHKITLSASNGGQCSGAGNGASSSVASSAASAQSSAAGSSAPASSAAATSSAPAESNTAASSQPAYSAPASSEASKYASSMPASSAASYMSESSAASSAASAKQSYAASVASAKQSYASVISAKQSSAASAASAASVTQSSAASSTPANSAAQSYASVISAKQSSAASAASAASATQSSAASSTPANSAAQSSAAPSNTAAQSSAAPSNTAASATASGSACQTSLTGAYQTPHLIVPVSSSSPDQAYGTSYNGVANSTTSTIFNFDIPASYAGKQCSVIFLFPEMKDLTTSSYTFSGSGSLEFSELSSPAQQSTTYSSVPATKKELAQISIMSGNSYVVSTMDCPAGEVETIEIQAEGGLSLEFFEDYNPSPLGLYITAC